MATYSSWGVVRTLLQPSRELYNSPWGKATTTLEGSRDGSNSPWTVVNLTLRNPHLPVGVLMPGNVMKYVPIQTLMAGNQLR